MNRSEMRELHTQGLENLQGILHDKQEHLLKNIRIRLAAGEGVNPHEARETRRDIAQIKTLIREKELGIERRLKTAGAAGTESEQA